MNTSDISSDIPSKMPMDAPVDTPADTPVNQPADTPVNKPEDTALKTPYKDTASHAGKGIPARKPLPGRPLDTRTRTQHDVSVEASLRLPSERDESSDMTNDTPDPMIQQARRDIKNGIQDTSKSPEMNQAYKKLK